MKLTLLDMTQSILSAMDADDVSAIDETVESVQVADLIKEAYFDLMSQRDWPHLRTLSALEGLGDVSHPTKMRMAENMNKVFWIKYNKKDVRYLTPEEFTHIIDQRVPQTDIIDANGFGLVEDPGYWTSYDDEYVVFDSRNSVVDNTLQQSKCKVYGTIAPGWQHTNTFIPDLPEKFFPTLLAEAKAQAFVNLKQQANVREERKAQRGRVIMRNESWRNENGEAKYNTRVNYGRK